MRSVGLDIGSTNVKAALVEIPDGGAPVRTVAVRSAPTPADATALVRVALDLLGAVLDGGAAAVGIASMAESGVPLGADDTPLGQLLRWDPHRAQPQADELAARLGRRELFRATGVRPGGKVPLATWAYLRAHDADRWSAMRRWAGAADLVALALTGRLLTDHTLAGRTMAYRLPAPGEGLPAGFDAGLLAEVGLRPEQLPEVVRPGEPPARAGPGTVVPAGTPVVVAGHDHPVGAWAGGVREPGAVADSLGTAEALVRVLGGRPDPDAVAAAGMSLVRTVRGDREALVAGSASAGAMVAWLGSHLGDGVDVEALMRRATARVRRPDAPLVLPYLRGRQAPAPDPGADLRVLGAPPADDVELAGAVIDGLALQARWMLVEQARLAGADPARSDVVVLGGGDRGAWLAAKVASGPARLRRVLAPEPVATGAALLAAWRAGLAGPAVLATAPVAGDPDPAYDPLADRFVRAALEGAR